MKIRREKYGFAVQEGERSDSTSKLSEGLVERVLVYSEEFIHGIVRGFYTLKHARTWRNVIQYSEELPAASMSSHVAVPE